MTHFRRVSFEMMRVKSDGLRIKLRRQAKRAQRRKLTAALEAVGHHRAETTRIPAAR
jgi:hypothetical protein